MSEEEVKDDALFRKRIGLLALTAAGATLLVTGRTARYLTRRNNVDAVLQPSQFRFKTKLKHLSPNEQHFSFVNNRSLTAAAAFSESPAPASLWQFVKPESTKEVEADEKPAQVYDDFNPALHAAQAFSIATVIVAVTFSGAAYWISRALDVHDVCPFSLFYAV